MAVLTEPRPWPHGSGHGVSFQPGCLQAGERTHLQASTASWAGHGVSSQTEGLSGCCFSRFGRFISGFWSLLWGFGGVFGVFCRMLEFFDVFFNDFLRRLQIFRVFLEVFEEFLQRSWGVFRWFLRFFNGLSCRDR